MKIYHHNYRPIRQLWHDFLTGLMVVALIALTWAIFEVLA